MSFDNESLDSRMDEEVRTENYLPNIKSTLPGSSSSISIIPVNPVGSNLLTIIDEEIDNDSDMDNDSDSDMDYESDNDNDSDKGNENNLD